MKIQGLYAAVAVRDFEVAVDWYSRLFGRLPDDRPMEGLVQWRWGSAGVQIFKDEGKSGGGRMTLVTPVMAETRRQLAEVGLEPEPDIKGDFGVIAQILDPEGNRVTLAEPPKT